MSTLITTDCNCIIFFSLWLNDDVNRAKLMCLAESSPTQHHHKHHSTNTSTSLAMHVGGCHTFLLCYFIVFIALLLCVCVPARQHFAHFSCPFRLRNLHFGELSMVVSTFGFCVFFSAGSFTHCILYWMDRLGMQKSSALYTYFCSEFWTIWNFYVDIYY